MKVVLTLCTMALALCLSTPVSAIIITSTTTDPSLSTLPRDGSVYYVHTGVNFPKTNDVLELTLNFTGKKGVELWVYDTPNATDTDDSVMWTLKDSGTTIDLFDVIVNGNLQGGTVSGAFNLSLMDFPAGDYSLFIKNLDRRTIDISSAMTFCL